MPVPSSIVGASTDAFTKPVGARWLMAYAAGIDDPAPTYVDTRRPDGIVGHPLFPVCLEWDPVLAARSLVPSGVLSREELVRGVHATHDLRIHRLVVPGDVLTTTATVAGVERRRPGAFEVLRLETVDERGGPVATTLMGSLFLGVDVEGPDRPATDQPADVLSVVPEPVAHTRARKITATAAHVYTECSRIWNPIHTDPAVAAVAGLPGLILHGTATLAMAVTEVMRTYSLVPDAVRRIRGRFGAMVLMPSVITVVVAPVVSSGRGVDEIRFIARNEAGAAAFRGSLAVVNGRRPPVSGIRPGAAH